MDALALLKFGEMVVEHIEREANTWVGRAELSDYQKREEAMTLVNQGDILAI